MATASKVTTFVPRAHGERFPNEMGVKLKNLALNENGGNEGYAPGLAGQRRIPSKFAAVQPSSGVNRRDHKI